MAGVCPCMSLQKGTIILAIIDAVLNGILLALITVGFVGLCLISPDDPEYNITQEEKTWALVFIAIAMLVCVFQITLAVYLRRSARDNNSTGCFRWLIITLVLFVLSIISISVSNSQASSGFSIGSGIIGLLYKIYELVVVYSFMKELNTSGMPNYGNGGV